MIRAPLALVPVTIGELYQTPEDYYLSFWVGSFLRLIRLLGNNLAVALPDLYIAVTDFHPELLPPTGFSDRGHPYPGSGTATGGAHHGDCRRGLPGG